MSALVDIILQAENRASPEINQVTNAIGNLEKAAGPTNKGLDGLSSILKTGLVAAASAATAALAGIGTGIGISISKAVDFETAFTGVVKTVDATDEELKNIRDSILDMSDVLPLSANEIAGVAEAAGQLGIKTENIMDFTRVMADLGVTTNMTAEQAAMDLARFANIVQMPQENFDRLGSTIAELGNNLATTEGEIVSMSLRLAGAGSQAGMSEAEILALSGSLSSVGIAAEAGGGAFSRLIISMISGVASGGEELDAFAKAAGVSADEFARAFKEDAAGALVMLLQGLNSTKESGGNLFAVLESIGIKETELTRAIVATAQAHELVANSFDIANQAWEDNNALTKEAELRYSTTESKIQLFWNAIDKLAIGIGDSLLPVFGDMIAVLTRIVQNYGPGLVSVFEKIGLGLSTFFGEMNQGNGTMGSFIKGMNKVSNLGLGEFVDSATLAANSMYEFGRALGGGDVNFNSFFNTYMVIEDILNSMDVQTSSIDNLYESIFSVIKVIFDLGTTIKEAITGFFEWSDLIPVLVMGLANMLIPAITSLIGFLAPVVTIIVAVTTATALLRTAWENDWLGIKTIIQNTWEVITEVFSGVISTISSLVEFFQTRMALIEAVNGSMGDKVLAVWELLKSSASVIWNGIVDIVQTLWSQYAESVSNWATASWEWISDSVSKVMPLLNQWWESIIGFIDENYPTWLSTMTTWATTAWEWIVNAAKSIGSGLNDWWKIISDFLSTNLPKWIESMQKFASSAWEWVKEATSNITPAITEWFTSIISFLGSKIPEWLAAFYEWKTSLVQWIIDVIPNAIQNLADFIQNLREGGKKGSNSFMEMVGEWATIFFSWIEEKVIPQVGPAFMGFVTKLVELGGSMISAITNLVVQLSLLLWEWIVKVTPIALEKLGQWGSTLMGWITENWPMWQSKLSEWGTAAWKWIQDAIGPALEQLSLWGSQLWGWITTNAPEWGKALSEWLKAAWTWIKDASAPALEQLKKWGEGLWGWITLNLPEWVKGLSEWLKAAWVWIQEASGPALEWLGKLTQELLTWIEKSLPDWITEFSKWLLATWIWIQEASGPALEWLGSLTQNLIDWIVESLPGWVDALADWLYEAWIWIDNAWEKLGPSINEFTDNIIDWIIEVLPDWIIELAKWAVAAYIWVDEAWKELDKKLTTFWNNIYAWFQTVKSWVNDWKDIGHDIIAGLWKGISEKWSNFLNDVGRLVNQLPQWVKDILWIRSPSGVFQEIGTAIGDGLKLGISNSIGGAIGVVKSSAEEIKSIAASITGDITKLASDTVNKAAEAKKAIQDAYNSSKTNIPSTSTGNNSNQNNQGNDGKSSSKTLVESLGLDTLANSIIENTGKILGGINLTVDDYTTNEENRKKAQAKLNDYVSGLTEFISETYKGIRDTEMSMNSSLLKLISEGKSQSTEMTELRNQMNQLNSTRNVLINAVKDITGATSAEIEKSIDSRDFFNELLTKTLTNLQSGVEMNDIQKLLQMAVDYRNSVKQFMPNTKIFKNVMPDDPRLTGIQAAVDTQSTSLLSFQNEIVEFINNSIDAISMVLRDSTLQNRDTFNVNKLSAITRILVENLNYIPKITQEAVGSIETWQEMFTSTLQSMLTGMGTQNSTSMGDRLSHLANVFKTMTLPYSETFAINTRNASYEQLLGTQPTYNVTNNITLQSSGDPNADVLSLMELLTSIQGSNG